MSEHIFLNKGRSWLSQFSKILSIPCQGQILPNETMFRLILSCIFIVLYEILLCQISIIVRVILLNHLFNFWVSSLGFVLCHCLDVLDYLLSTHLVVLWKKYKNLSKNLRKSRIEAVLYSQWHWLSLSFQLDIFAKPQLIQCTTIYVIWKEIIVNFWQANLIPSTVKFLSQFVQ